MAAKCAGAYTYFSLWQIYDRQLKEETTKHIKKHLWGTFQGTEVTEIQSLSCVVYWGAPAVSEEPSWRDDFVRTPSLPDWRYCALPWGRSYDAALPSRAACTEAVDIEPGSCCLLGTQFWNHQAGDPIKKKPPSNKMLNLQSDLFFSWFCCPPAAPPPRSICKKPSRLQIAINFHWAPYSW